MFRNYLRIAWRNISRNRMSAAINIFGLALGLAASLIISLFVINELRYDRFNKKADRIYRLEADMHPNDVITYRGTKTPLPLATALVREYPAIEQSVRLYQKGDLLLKKGRETFLEPRSAYADSTLFNIFTLPLLAGNPQTALTAPFSMVISESMARKYFNSTDVLGKTLVTNDTVSYKITGVMKDMPARSHFHFDFFRAMSELNISRANDWFEEGCATYILVRPGTDPGAITAAIDGVTRKYIDPILQGFIHSTLDELAKTGHYIRYPIMPLSRIHLHSHLPDEFEANGNIQYVRIFVVISLFILLVACVNFMNLSTARAAGRSKEVGIRKVLGSAHTGLISQFLTESVVTTILSMVLGVLITWLLLPYFNQVSGQAITLDLFSNAWLIIVLLGASIVVGVLAGSYPAFYLSSVHPMQVMKGKAANGFKSGWLRNSLVVFQFTVAILLIVGTLVIYSQLNYIRNKDLGYHREQVLILRNTAALSTHARTFRDEVLRIPGVISGTITSDLPNGGSFKPQGYFLTPTFNFNNTVLLQIGRIDADYIPTLGIQMAAGRNFSPLMPTDSSAVLLNETAVKVLGFKDPLHKTVYTYGANGAPLAQRIIGVVKDFHVGSLHDAIAPMLFTLGEQAGAISFRLQTGNIPAVVGKIKEAYHAQHKMAGQPFLYSFMDDDFNRLYQSDQRTGKIFISFTGLAILIACLGLFGLVTFAAEQRTKEIGIRKVLGATVTSVVGLLSKDFIKLVLLAGIIACPLAWWGMHKWLENFAYRTHISGWIFVAAAGIVAMITLATVSFRTIKAALVNPVTSLRSE
ncbi:ABC transporter permease [Chitinophaga japonensis]|nr:ABC transporter permease [Chitinophaga japonensis]